MSTQLEPRVQDQRLPTVGAREQLLTGVPVEDHRRQLAGVSTAVLEGGVGPPILFLHGPGEFAARWLRVVPRLVSTNRVIAPDFPDHGSSEVLDEQLDADRVFRWLDEVIQETCSTPPIVVGHLLGGSIAARFAVRRPDSLSRLVLVDSFGLGRFRPSPRFMYSLVRALARPNEKNYDRFMGQCLADRDTFREQVGDLWDPLRDYSLELARTPRVKTAMRFYMRELGVPRIPEEDLERISAPTSLIWGREDRANRVKIAEAASARYGWPLRVIENAADDPPMEQPEAFVAALRAAIDDS